MLNKDKTKEWMVGKSAYQVFLSIKERLKDLSSDDQREIWAIYHEINEPTPEERKQIMDRLF